MVVMSNETFINLLKTCILKNFLIGMALDQRLCRMTGTSAIILFLEVSHAIMEAKSVRFFSA